MKDVIITVTTLIRTFSKLRKEETVFYCKVFNCINNNGSGYCCDHNYIIIDEDGSCSDMLTQNNQEDDTND